MVAPATHTPVTPTSDRQRAQVAALPARIAPAPDPVAASASIVWSAVQALRAPSISPDRSENVTAGPTWEPALGETGWYASTSELYQPGRGWLVGRRGSSPARRVPLRGGRNARPLSPGPSGPTRGQGGAPAGRHQALGPFRLAGVGGRGRTTLTRASIGPGGSPRRVRASAERGRVQGPGRAEADLGPSAPLLSWFDG